MPRAEVMGVIGVMALAANLVSVLLLMLYNDGDANVRSVWICSRNNAIGNVAVMIAALGVWESTAWPALAVAGIMAGLFLTSSVQILNRLGRKGRQVRQNRITLDWFESATAVPAAPPGSKIVFDQSLYLSTLAIKKKPPTLRPVRRAQDSR